MCRAAAATLTSPSLAEKVSENLYIVMFNSAWSYSSNCAFYRGKLFVFFHFIAIE